MEINDSLQSGILLQVGKYKIEKVLGQGGFGITYKAKYRHEVEEAIGKMIVESDVAIKEFFIKNECERDENSNGVTVPSIKKVGFVEDYRRKFVKEANNLSQLCHDNIVKVIDIFEENSTAYFVMEYIDGESLDSMVEKNGAMSETEARGVISQLANAVDYIHRNKVSHFDIKPANIMLLPEGKIKLIDFGLSKHYDEDGKQTTTGSTQGVSEGYSPIEQYKFGSLKQFSPQTDIYSVGATMAYLLTGKVPPSALDNKLPVLPSSVSKSIKQGIYAAMANAIEDRPKSIGEFMQLIDENLQTQASKFVEPKSQIKSPQGFLLGNTAVDSNKTKVLGGDHNGRRNRRNPNIKYWILGGIVAVVFIILGVRACNNNTILIDGLDNEIIEEYDGTINGYKYVDLGLPSGLKWATCNMGASLSNENGNYYAWGENFKKLEYTEENFKRYGGIDDISGNLEFDAARAHWGSSWRIPTRTEFLELMDNCNWEWINQDMYKGYKVTSKTNGKSIFIPAAGCCDGTLLSDDSYGNYWCSTPYMDDVYCANYLFFFGDNIDKGWHKRRYYIHWRNRRYGLSIRPVSE